MGDELGTNDNAFTGDGVDGHTVGAAEGCKLGGSAMISLSKSGVGLIDGEDVSNSGLSPTPTAYQAL